VAPETLQYLAAQGLIASVQSFKGKGSGSAVLNASVEPKANPGV